MALINRCRRSVRHWILACSVSVVCIWLVKIVFTSIIVLFGHNNPILGDSRCRELWLNHYVRRMCYNYTKSIIFGDICETICYDSDIVVNHCFVHHEETTVVDVTINGQKRIMKVKDVGGTVDSEIMDQLNQIWHHFLMEHEFPTGLLDQFIIDHFQQYLGKEVYDISPQKRRQILQAVLPEQSQYLSEEQLKSIYFLLRIDGILPLMYYQREKHIPKFYGNCGQLYVVETLTPFSTLFPTLLSPLSWTKRAVLAISFLDFMITLQLAADGPLQICDFKGSDFGFTSSYQVKLIDLGMLFTERKVKVLVNQGTCQDDKGCEFFDCRSTCDTKIRVCSATLRTNNVQMLCKNIFRQSWPLKGLLSDIPSRIRTPLDTMIDKCSSDKFGYLRVNSSVVQELVLDMRMLLARDVGLK